MKRFIAVLSGLLVLPAFAEVAPVYYDEIVEYTDDMIDAVDSGEYAEETQTQSVRNVQPKTTINRSTSRAISTGAPTTATRGNTSSRAMAANPRATVSRGTTSRTAARTATPTRTRVTARSATSAKPVTARVGVSGTVSAAPRTVNAATIRTLNDSNIKYNATNTTVGTETSARVGLANRRATARVSTPVAVTSTPVITQEEVDQTSSNLNALAELTDLCKAQYAACMDNYCNVLDDNQGRCSCSKNIKNYEKTEEALKTASEQLNDIAQKISYIGLTGEQIETLFTETEAEIAMRSNTDKSQIKTSLDSLKRKIVDVSTPNATSYEAPGGISIETSGLFNIDLTNGFELSSFLNMSNNKSTSSVVNQRGEQLYKSASNRCKTQVLQNCTAQGVEANVITNSYDLEIDKQCVVYERSLNEANNEVRTLVRNATTLLQHGRLMLAQNRNSYDVRGCVAAIDACMQDEYVCGSDYEMCLDPTGKYIANGEIIIGGTPGVSGGMYANTDVVDSADSLKDWKSGGMWELYQAWNYNSTGVGIDTTQCTKATCTTMNAWGIGQSETLGGYLESALRQWKKDFSKTTPTKDMAMYLLQKIGYIDSNDKVHGMCASVMKQCQDYTYDTKKSKKEYKADNEVIRQYLASTLTKIKIQQDEILADYVQECRGNVTSCLSENGYDESNAYTTASQTAVNACRAEIQTCMSVGGWKPSDNTRLTLRQMSDWVRSTMTSCPENYYLFETGTTGATWNSECRVCPTTEILIAVSSNQPVDEGHLMDTTVFHWSANGYSGKKEIILPNGVSYRVARKNGSTLSQYEVSCKPSSNPPACGTQTTGTAYVTQNTTEDDLTQSTINLISSGGQTTSCDCPVGYTEYVYRYQYTESTETGGVWTENKNPRWRAGDIKKFCIFVPESKSAI